MRIVLARKVPGAKIMAETEDGQVMILVHRFAHRDDVKLITTIAAIRARGSINPTLWRAAKTTEY